MSSQRPDEGSRVCSRILEAPRYLRTTTAALSCALLLVPLICARAAQALTFNFTPVSGTSQQAINGFNAAGNLWSSFLSDNVTININIGFSALGSGVLAQAGSTTQGFSYSDVRAALSRDASSSLDAIAVSNLQGGNALQFLTNNTAGDVVLDNDGSGNNVVLDINTANAKALGLIAANNSGRDATIEFSTSFTYDFDRSDGITGGTFDFVGLAAHEIGHALGFVSGVDEVDFFSGPKTGPRGAMDLNGFRVFNTLDLFRYSSASTNPASAGFGLQDLTQGTESYFSVDKGVTAGAAFSTGPFDGDGSQASHWKDNQGLGIMDPTAAPGELLLITGNDLGAFDAIGWNLTSVEVPEPSALHLIGGALFMLGGVRVFRRRKRAG